MNPRDATFPDHFSVVANEYATWRPHYPAALFDAIAEHLPAPPMRLWEAGCGSGQATIDLAERFGEVFATDPSSAQIAAHPANQMEHARVRIAVEPAESCSLGNSSVELVAVAQALHWFDQRSFFAECARVLVPGGVLAAWCYQDFVPPPGMERAVADFRATIHAHWPPQRGDVESGYKHYDWPFAALPGRSLDMVAHWTLPQLLGYLSSLSATARTQRAAGLDPLAVHGAALAEAWGEANQPRRIIWPLQLTMRKVA